MRPQPDAAIAHEFLAALDIGEQSLMVDEYLRSVQVGEQHQKTLAPPASHEATKLTENTKP